MSNQSYNIHKWTPVDPNYNPNDECILCKLSFTTVQTAKELGEWLGKTTEQAQIMLNQRNEKNVKKLHYRYDTLKPVSIKTMQKYNIREYVTIFKGEQNN